MVLPTPGPAGPATEPGNPGVDPISSLGDGTRPGPRHLSPRLQTLWQAQAAGTTALLAAVLAVTAAVAQTNDGSAVPALWFAVLAVVVVGLAVSATVPARAWQRWTYDLGEQTLELSHGLVTHRRSVLPYFRVQHIDLVAGPLERSLGITRLVVRTASATTDSQIPGVAADEAERLRSTILARAGQGDAV